MPRTGPLTRRTLPLVLALIAGSMITLDGGVRAYARQDQTPQDAKPVEQPESPPPDNGEHQPEEAPPAEEGDNGEKKPDEEKAEKEGAGAEKKDDAKDEKKPESKPAEPEPEPAPLPPATTEIKPREHRVEPPLDARGRRTTTGKTTTLAFKGVTVERVIPFIVESTGKVVLPQQEILSRKVTIINDREIPQAEALDLVFLALQQAGIAVVETPKLVLLRDIAEIIRQDVPVLGPDESVLDRTDLGAIAEKVYRLEHISAESLKDTLDDQVPDYAAIIFETESNQVVVRGNIALLQRMELLISSLDRPNAASLRTETFRLRFADAEQVATNIKDLFSDDSSRSTQGGQNRNFPQFFGPQQQQQSSGRRGNNNQRQGQSGNNAASQTSVAPSGNLRVTANKQQNSVTVLAEPQILDQIRDQVDQVWDRPLAQEAVVPRIYDLKNSDPVKVKALLEGLFGSPSADTGGTSSTQGVGRLAGQFSFQAIPEAGRLVVVSKSPDNLFVIDEIIKGVDQPQSAGLPEIVELKHASSEELAEQLNALLAQEGTLAQIVRSESGLTTSSSSVSPFASESTDTGDGSTGSTDTGGSTTTSSDTITFWWQRARPPTDNQGQSNLVAKARIVPVWRQNAVMVLAPPEYRQPIVNLVQSLDKPGRQVLIAAVIAEITGEDATALGLRWSSQSLNATNPDNSLSIGTSTTGTKNNLIDSLFDTSVLDVDADLNLLLQALNEKTKINILSEPRIFTSDNQEAEFFSGQDIPFITDSQVTDQGNQIQSFDYRAVGIALRVRPRITVNRDVDLRVNLELSSIQPQQTLFGGFIVDRRETTTQLIIRDGQTIVISGILRSEESDIKRKVPLLGDIPLIGLLFQSTEKTLSNTELVAFITPIVVDNEVRMDEVNKEPRKRLRELRGILQKDVVNKVPSDEGKPIDEPPIEKPE